MYIISYSHTFILPYLKCTKLFIYENIYTFPKNLILLYFIKDKCRRQSNGTHGWNSLFWSQIRFIGGYVYPSSRRVLDTWGHVHRTRCAPAHSAFIAPLKLVVATVHRQPRPCESDEHNMQTYGDRFCYICWGTELNIVKRVSNAQM